MSRSLALIVVLVISGVAAVFLARAESLRSVLTPGPPVPQRIDVLGTGPLGSAPRPLDRWRYRADPREQGRAGGWTDGGFGGRMVTVPFSPNARTLSGPGAEAGYRGTIGWYARTILVQTAGRYVLSFASAHHRATVYVDGRRIRGHLGAYEPFAAAADLTEGRHAVSVRVNWRGPRRQAREGFGRGWFNFGGLNGPVTISRAAKIELGALNVTTRVGSDGAASVRVRVRVRNRGATRLLGPEGSLARGRARVPLAFTPQAVPAGSERTFTAAVLVPGAALWSPDAPRRYTLTVELPREARIRRNVGLRELRWSGGRLRLNGLPLRLRGVGLPADAARHGDAFTPRDEARTIEQLRASGANATRAQHPLSETMLDRLDAAGILLWQEIGPWEPAGAFRAPSVASARDRALRAAEREQPHASVVAWTLTNEASGGGRPRQIAYVQQTAGALHRRDPSRPVAVDFWGKELPRAAGPLLDAVDLLGVTDYTGWYEGSELPGTEQEAELRGRLATLRRLVPEKPIVITEFGAAGTPRVAPTAFGGVRFQAQLLARRTQALERLPGLSGEMVWLLRDHAIRPTFHGGSVLTVHPGLRLKPGINEKGLYDEEGRPKPALAAVRAAFGAASG